MDNMLRQIEAFMKRHDMEPSRFGIEALNDSSFVFSLRKGERSPRRKTIRRVKDFMSGYVPPET